MASRAVLVWTSLWTLACMGGPLDGVDWDGTCSEVSTEPIRLTTTTPAEPPREGGHIANLEGEYEMWSMTIELNGAGYEGEPYLGTMVHCIDEGGCEDDEWTWDPEMVTLSLTRQDGTDPPMYAWGFLEEKRLIVGSCLWSNGVTGVFELEGSR